MLSVSRTKTRWKAAARNQAGRLGEYDRIFMITKHCVLLAEDNLDEVYLLRWAFRRAGLPHETIEVRDGVVTMEYLKGTPPFNDRARYPFPRLLLLDLKMPKVNGLEVLAWLETRPEFSSLPAVVLSSSAFQGDSQKALDLGAGEIGRAHV